MAPDWLSHHVAANEQTGPAPSFFYFRGRGVSRIPAEDNTCHGRGTYGRRAIFEALLVDDEVHEAIEQGATALDLRGVVTLWELSPAIQSEETCDLLRLNL
jgi:type II secretory ATPase GspE/PulE/Tfp pilus assembly ATPase PilB-like protein